MKVIVTSLVLGLAIVVITCNNALGNPVANDVEKREPPPPPPSKLPESPMQPPELPRPEGPAKSEPRESGAPEKPPSSGSIFNLFKRETEDKPKELKEEQNLQIPKITNNDVGGKHDAQSHRGEDLKEEKIKRSTEGEDDDDDDDDDSNDDEEAKYEKKNESNGGALGTSEVHKLKLTERSLI